MRPRILQETRLARLLLCGGVLLLGACSPDDASDSREPGVVRETGTAPAPLTSAFVSRIRVGAGQLTDSRGVVWAADQGFTGGTLYQSTATIQDTSDPALYQHERYGNFSYAVPVPAAGTYHVRLLFAELYFSAAGQRVFDVSAEGTLRARDIDIFARAGKDRASSVDFQVPVSDGVLNLSFISKVNNAKVSAIEIRRYEWPEPPLSAPVVYALTNTLIHNLSAGTTQAYSKTKDSSGNTNPYSGLLSVPSTQDAVILLPGGSWTNPAGQTFSSPQKDPLQRDGGMVVNGGRNLLVKGGGPNRGGIRHDINYVGGPTDSGAKQPAIEFAARSERMRGIYVRGWAGVLDIRDLRIDGSELFEATNFSSGNPQSVLRLQRVRFGGVQLFNYGSGAGNHDGGDVIQTWFGPDLGVQIADITLESDNFQAFWFQPAAQLTAAKTVAAPDTTVLKRVNVKAYGRSRYTYTDASGDTSYGHFWNIFGVLNPMGCASRSADGSCLQWVSEPQRSRVVLTDFWAPPLPPPWPTAVTHITVPGAAQEGFKYYLDPTVSLVPTFVQPTGAAPYLQWPAAANIGGVISFGAVPGGLDFCDR